MCGGLRRGAITLGNTDISSFLASWFPFIKKKTWLQLNNRRCGFIENTAVLKCNRSTHRPRQTLCIQAKMVSRFQIRTNYQSNEMQTTLASIDLKSADSPDEAVKFGKVGT